MTLSLLLAGVGWLVLGALIGTLHMLTLGWNVRLFASGGPLARALVLQALRLGLVAAIMAAVAIHEGALPLLLAAVGILLARTVAVRRSTRA